MFDEQGDQPAKVTWAHLAGGAHLSPAPGQGAREQQRELGGGESMAGLEPGHRGCPARPHGSGDTAGRPLHRAPDLSPEQRHVYDLAARWYVTLFGERPVRVIDEDPWGTDLPGDVRLVGPAGIAFTDAADRPEIRLLAFGARTGPPPVLVESPAIRFALLRRPDWLEETVRVCVADLVHGSLAEDVIDVGVARSEIDEWLAGRLQVIRARVADPVAVPGLECGWCPFIAGCKAHR